MADLHSPLAIWIALHYWSRPERYAWREPEYAYSGGVAEIKRALTDLGLLEPLPPSAALDGPDPDYAPVREPLSLYVEALGRVPYPVKKWMMP